MQRADADEPPSTRPGEAVWRPPRAGYRVAQIVGDVGVGSAAWERAGADVLRWRVKTRSGFAVVPDTPVVPGARPTIVARVLGVRVREPVEVVEVVRTATRIGFSYRTLPGHPVDGEESFTVCRDGDRVHLEIRSLTRPARRGVWRMLFPVLLLAQAVVRRRYVRAL
jgi:uncharacterized protein (UPF0548 family)